MAMSGHQAKASAEEPVDRQGTVDAESPAPQRRYENDEYAAMLRRMVAAYGERVGASDPYDLADMLGVLADLDEQVGLAVRALRAGGYSWQDIGDGAGITRQAAQQRWGTP